MKSRLGTLIAALAVATLTGAAVCGDGSDRAADAPSGSATDASGDSTPPEWVDAFAGSTFSARYEFSGTGEGALSGVGAMRLFKRGADRLRVDIRFTLSDDAGASGDAAATSALSLIQTPDLNAFCIDEPGIFGIFGLNRPKTCIRGDALDDNASFDSGEFLDRLSGPEVDRNAFQEATIAGRDARCYKTPAGDSARRSIADEGTATPDASPLPEQEACFSREGLLLRITGSDVTQGASQVSDAQDLTDSVDAGVFDPPYPLFEPESIEVRNDSDAEIFVELHSDDGAGFGGVQEASIDAHSSKTIHGGLDSAPSRVEFGAYDTPQTPQWAWVCAWDDAKAHEPLTVRYDASNCNSATRRPGWDPNAPRPRRIGATDYPTPIVIGTGVAGLENTPAEGDGP